MADPRKGVAGELADELQHLSVGGMELTVSHQASGVSDQKRVVIEAGALEVVGPWHRQARWRRVGTVLTRVDSRVLP